MQEVKPPRRRRSDAKSPRTREVSPFGASAMGRVWRALVEDWRSAFKKDGVEELYPRYKMDRRVLAHAPIRGQSRRILGYRYEADFFVTLYPPKGARDRDKALMRMQCADLSYSGVLLQMPEGIKRPAIGDKFFIRFYMPSGVLPEGYESSVELEARVVRFTGENDSLMALEFEKSLTKYLEQKRWRIFDQSALFLLFVCFLFVIVVKMESFFYFLFDVPVFLYGLMASAFLLTRFIFAAFYKEVPVDPNYCPSVSVIIPCFNEEEWIIKTIRTCLDQDYPPEKLEVLLVDDGSTDQSIPRVREFEERYKEEVGDRFRVVLQPTNMGKRHAMAAGLMQAKHNLLVFVDSDSFLEPDAVRVIVQPFKDPNVGAISGRTEVENKWTNFLTKMQAVRYYVAFRVFKGAEGIFDTVTCLSGPLACYRRDLVERYLDAWLGQTFLGRPATFGDDRSMTNFILKYDRTGYQHSAVCSTIVPSKMRQFMKQQMRWKRSWLRETGRAATFMWKKEPFAAISFYSGLVLPILAPFVVIRTFVIVPIIYGTMPLTFLIGFLLMSMLMSASYLLLKKSNLWLYGVLFCVFYLTVLLWQFLPAIFTFWVSEWGTRATVADVKAAAKREAKQQHKSKKKSPA